MSRFDDLMSAISFAEAGEHGAARDILAGRNTILLAVSEEKCDSNIFRYAINLSKRVKAAVDVLYLKISEAGNTLLQEFLSEAQREGIPCTLVTEEGCMKKAILDYTEKKKEILFVVVGSTPELNIECKGGGKALSDAWKNLRCPLVVVSKNDMPLKT